MDMTAFGEYKKKIKKLLTKYPPFNKAADLF